MEAARTLPLMTTVLSGSGPEVHLALARTPSAAATPETLCVRPVGAGTTVRSYHRLGCPACARVALELGITSVQDLDHATVNLPRFLAAHARRADPSRTAAFPTQPGAPAAESTPRS
jgi:hypothetical protein